MTPQKTSSALATALRVIGVLSIIGGFGTGMDFYNGAFRGEVGIVISCTLAGIMTCLICFAIAKCTQAASIYLDKIKQNNEKTSATNQPKKESQSTNNNVRVRRMANQVTYKRESAIDPYSIIIDRSLFFAFSHKITIFA